MSVKQHLMDGEDVLSHVVTSNWAWIATDRRIVKYRKSDRGSEQLADLSYDEVSGISLTETPRNTKYLVVSALSTISLVLFVTTQVIWLSLVAFVISAVSTYLWYRSDRSYFQLKGTGLVQQEPQKWRIQASDGDSDDVREFVKSVRSQL